MQMYLKQKKSFHKKESEANFASDFCLISRILLLKYIDKKGFFLRFFFIFILHFYILCDK